jgi:predicted nucleic acid-binding protein
MSQDTTLIICDSSPLIGLAIIDNLHLLDELFGRVMVPNKVFEEATMAGKPGAVEIAKWAKDKVQKVSDTAVVEAFRANLDPGESEALALYRETKADFLLIDEKRARRTAMLQKMNVIGTVGVLIIGKDAHLIERIKPYMDTLISADFRISTGLYQYALELAGEVSYEQI